jgi:hypothetical protein
MTSFSRSIEDALVRTLSWAGTGLGSIWLWNEVHHVLHSTYTTLLVALTNTGGGW